MLSESELSSPMNSFILRLLPVFLAATLNLHAEEPTDVSLVQLVATPERFDGKAVRVIGFLHLEPEGTALYLHSEDLIYTLVKNGVWVNPTADFKKKLSDRYVLIEGTFDARDHGHKGLWSGAIRDVTRATPWSPKAKKSKKKKDAVQGESEKTKTSLML